MEERVGGKPTSSASTKALSSGTASSTAEAKGFYYDASNVSASATTGYGTTDAAARDSALPTGVE